MQTLFGSLENLVALGCEIAAALVLAIGAVQILATLALNVRRLDDLRLRKTAWLGFASWILIALELTLAADVVRTAIAPTWSEIGQLGAIALIRTGLSLFLERDVEESFKLGQPTQAEPQA
jgi:uncharacterized membrane protein